MSSKRNCGGRVPQIWFHTKSYVFVNLNAPHNFRTQDNPFWEKRVVLKRQIERRGKKCHE
jgi:hypothetical protein